jgi:serine O-acetyltransferase
MSDASFTAKLGAPPATDTFLPDLVHALTQSYASDPRGQRINRRYLPSRDVCIEIIEQLLQCLYPGFFGRTDLTDRNIDFHLGVSLVFIESKLTEQIDSCLCYDEDHTTSAVDAPRCLARARELTRAFLRELPALRAALLEDVQAAFDGDPAAQSLDEIVLAYPGLLAVTVYRIAHSLHALNVPLMPRILSEWAHSRTGADIHPGAAIGARFFLDHATGAVIGETTVIGSDVKLYQGVTLGALSIARDARGRVIRGTKRHPTVDNRVTVYANATVLGGQTVLGEGSVVGGSVFVTRSIPPGSRVALKAPDQTVQPAKHVTFSADWVVDFEI